LVVPALALAALALAALALAPPASGFVVPADSDFPAFSAARYGTVEVFSGLSVIHSVQF
jgi:hypothetical protein